MKKALLVLSLCLWTFTENNSFAGKNNAGSACSSSYRPQTESYVEAVPSYEDTLKALQNCTAQNFEQVNAECSPMKTCFKIHRRLENNEPVDAHLRAQMIISTVFAYLFWVEFCNPHAYECRNNIKFIVATIRKLTDTKKRRKIALNNKKLNFICKNFNEARKIKNINRSELLKKIFGNNAAIERGFIQFRNALISFCKLVPTRVPSKIFTKTFSPNSETFYEQGAQFGAPTCSRVIFRKASAAEKNNEKKLALKYFKLLAHNEANLTGFEEFWCKYGSLLYEFGDHEKGIRWLSYAAYNGDTIAKSQLENINKGNAPVPLPVALSTHENKNEKTLRTVQNLAISLEKKGEFDKAITLLEEYACDTMPYLYMMLSDLYRQKNNISLAIYWAIEAGDKRYNQGYYFAAMLLFEQKNYKDAISLFLKVSCKTLNMQDIKKDLYFQNLGLSYLNLGKHKKALSCFNKAVALDCNWSEGYYYYCKFKLGHTEQAIEGLEKRIKKTCLSPEMIYTSAFFLVEIYLLQNDYQNAKRHVQNASHYLLKDSALYYEMAILIYDNQKNEAASKLDSLLDYRQAQRRTKALACFIFCHFLYNNLGYGEEIDDIEKYAKLALKFGNYKAALTLANAYELKGRHELAEKYYKIAIAHGIKYSEKNYALLLDKLNRTDEANQAFENIEEESNEPSVEKTDDNDDESESDNNQKQESRFQDYVDVKNTKKYKRMLEKAKKSVTQINRKSCISLTDSYTDRSYLDINVTASSQDILGEIRLSENRIQSLLSQLANGIKAGKFEFLTGYKKRASMRITQGNRLVFDIVEGGIHAPEGVKGIVIVSAKGHYREKDMNRDEFETHTSINAPWVKAQTDDNDSD